MRHSTSEITKIFYEYYQNLYNVNKGQGDIEVQNRREKIKQYLEKIKTPGLAEEEISDLEKEITKEEISQVIKSIKMGKSPGPDGFTSLYYKRFGGY